MHIDSLPSALRTSLISCLFFAACAAFCAIPLHAAQADNEEAVETAGSADDSSTAADAANAADGEGQETGLPVPRFVALRFETVNIRTGPGNRYPIRWVYARKNLPVEVTEEFGQWRKIKDSEGDEGWAHKSQLSGNRTVILLENASLLREPEKDAAPMVKAQKGVIAPVLECTATWCELQVNSYKAWAQKNRLWGVYSREEFKE